MVEDEDRSVMTDKPAADWIGGSKAVLWGKWRWPADVFQEIQRWGDSNACRFLLASEFISEGSAMPDALRAQDRLYFLSLYIAPKPTRRSTGLDGPSIGNRDRSIDRFTAWLEGYLAGRGLLFPGEDVRRS